MDKFSKYGLSALCGSLAAISAVNAGELSVTGSAKATWTSISKDLTGNPLGMASAITFKGSGELDGGQEFSVTMANNDKSAYSSGNITLNLNSLGTIVVSQAEGGQGIGGYDDNMPRAFEEAWDTGVGAGLDLQKGVGSSTNISLTTPKIMGSTVQVAFAGANDGAQVNDKATSGIGSRFQEGYDVVLDLNQDYAFYMPNVFIGYSETKQGKHNGADNKQLRHEHEEGVIGAVFSIGPVKAGLQKSIEHLGNEASGSTEYYGNISWGVSFNLNDDLSVSYGEHTGKKSLIGPGDQQDVVTQSFQIAYTMGGLSLNYADTSIDNAAYVQGSTGDKDGQLVALSLAF